MKKNILILLTLIMPSCASTYIISSKPAGAIVRSDGVELGKTPLIITSDKITQRYANGVILDLTLDGYQDLKVWLPEDGKTFNTTINLNPFYKRAQKDMQISNFEILRTDLNKLVYSMLETQKKLLTQSGEVKEEYLDNLIDANPTLGSAYYLKSLNLLQKDKKTEGLDILEEALRYAPKEDEFLQLYNEFKKDQKQ